MRDEARTPLREEGDGMNSKPEIKMEIVSGWLGIERSRLSFRSIVEREMSPTHAVATAARGNVMLAVPVVPFSAWCFSRSCKPSPLPLAV